MHLPVKNSFIAQCYSWYFSYIFKKDFSNFNYNELTVKDDEALLLLANRFSWWDGFMLFHLNKKLFKKQFHVLVTTDDYHQIAYLKYYGAFAPENKGKDMMKTLQYAGALLDDPKNLVLIFPQGKLKSSHVTSINFEKGVIQVINASKKKFQTVFSVILTDYFAERKSKANAYLKNWPAEEYISLQLLKSEYNKHYDTAILKQAQKAS
jgi:hypothetical protein